MANVQSNRSALTTDYHWVKTGGVSVRYASRPLSSHSHCSYLRVLSTGSMQLSSSLYGWCPINFSSPFSCRVPTTLMYLSSCWLRCSWRREGVWPLSYYHGEQSDTSASSSWASCVKCSSERYGCQGWPRYVQGPGALSLALKQWNDWMTLPSSSVTLSDALSPV